METENKFQEIISQLEEIKSSTNDENIINLILKLVEFKQETNDNDFYLDRFEDIALKLKTTGKYDNIELKRESLLNYLESFSQNIKTIKSLLEALIQMSDDQEGEAQPITIVNFISDYHSIFQ
jgi:hypothetical protein